MKANNIKIILAILLTYTLNHANIDKRRSDRMTNNDLGDMINDTSGIPMPLAFAINCLKGVKFSSTEDMKIFCVGRMVEIIHFETKDLPNGDMSPFLLKATYQNQGGMMEHLLRYFSLDDLEVMAPLDKFIYLCEQMEKQFGFTIL